MENIRNILAAIDLGESSKDAFVEARALAVRLEASLHLACVVQDPFSLRWAPTAPNPLLSALVAQM